MFKGALNFIIKHILWPVLHKLMEMVILDIALWILKRFRDLFGKWRREEEETASTDEQREAIRKKYDRREADLASVEQEVPEKVREIIRNAFMEAGKQTDALIAGTTKATALTESTKVLDAEPPKR